MSDNGVCCTTGKKTSMGLDENVAGALCYVLGFVSGIVFLIMEKDSKFVKFHAVQSIGISLLLVVFNTIVSTLLYGLFSFTMYWIVALLSSLISLAGLILWLVLIMKAFQGEQFKLPVIGDIAEKQAQA